MEPQFREITNFSTYTVCTILSLNSVCIGTVSVCSLYPAGTLGVVYLGTTRLGIHYHNIIVQHLCLIERLEYVRTAHADIANCIVSSKCQWMFGI